LYVAVFAAIALYRNRWSDIITALSSGQPRTIRCAVRLYRGDSYLIRLSVCLSNDYDLLEIGKP